MADADAGIERRRFQGDVLGRVVGDERIDQIDRADELGRKPVGRLLVDFIGRAHLLDPALVHQRDPGGHGHGLFLIVGDHDAGHAGGFDDVDQFQLHLRAQFFIQRTHRFVQQQQLGALGQRARQGHALLLPAGELVRLALGQRAKLHQFEHLADAAGDRSLGQAFLLQPEGDVLLHTHMRKQRVRLEHHVDRALVRRQCVDRLTIQDNAPLGRPLEPGKAAQQRGFAATGTTEQREDLALANLQADLVDRNEAVELLADRVDAQVAAVASGEVGLRGGLGGCH